VLVADELTNDLDVMTLGTLEELDPLEVIEERRIP
jgi:hypothetical protein